MTNRDKHNLYSQVGRQLGFVPVARVREAFMNIWARFYPDEVEEIAAPFKHLIPMDGQEIGLGGSAAN
ncbi:hypothetical protein D3C71_2104580 [compost metagenome]